MDRNIPKEELDKIEAHVMDQVHLVWDVGLEFVPLELTFCDRCLPTWGYVRQRCIGNMMTGERLCSHCWATKYEQELIDEWLQEHHRVLDVEDFARV